MENIPNSNYKDNIVFTDNSTRSHAVNSRLIIISVVVALVLGAGAYSVYNNIQTIKTDSISPTTNDKPPTEKSASGSMKKEDSLGAQPSIANTQATEILTCRNMEISLPNEWSNLQRAESKNLDSKGCYMDSQGCLCAKKDSQGNNVILSVLVTTPPSGTTLQSLVPYGALGVEKFDFFGNQAMRFVITGKNKVGSLNFFKSTQLYSFSISATSSTFENLWPDFLSKTSGIKFK